MIAPSHERRLLATGQIPPRRVTDAYLTKLIHRAHKRHREAVQADTDRAPQADRLNVVAHRRLWNALLQREREIAAYLGQCSRCGLRALRGVFDWPEMEGQYGHCVGCGSTIAVTKSTQETRRDL